MDIFWPLLRWHMLSCPFSSALAVAIACVTSRSTGWTNSRLRTSIRRPRTCYIFFADYSSNSNSKINIVSEEYIACLGCTFRMACAIWSVFRRPRRRHRVCYVAQYRLDQFSAPDVNSEAPNMLSIVYRLYIYKLHVPYAYYI